MKNVTIWHNPRCGKSRASLALLEQYGYAPRIVRYLEDPPSVADLKKVLGMLDKKPRELMRTKEARYKELGLASENSDAALIRAMHENPILIERPVVVCGQRAAIGRPPEDVLVILR